MTIKLNNAPLWITEKALAALKQLQSGRTIARRTSCKKYLTMRVNKRWRLLSRDDGKNWQLLTHNDYNHVIDK